MLPKHSCSCACGIAATVCAISVCADTAAMMASGEIAEECANGSGGSSPTEPGSLSLIHISEPTRLALI
eukprot:7073134-Alexandrium_andersonii.AAC.1